MSVLIKGMEMPKSCYDCPMMFERKSEILNTTYHDCQLLNIANFVDNYTSSRHPYCPIVELPPHGRLIDADELSEKLTDLADCEWNQTVGTSWTNAYEEVNGFLEDAQTIIEAEE